MRVAAHVSLGNWMMRLSVRSRMKGTLRSLKSSAITFLAISIAMSGTMEKAGGMHLETRWIMRETRTVPFLIMPKRLTARVEKICTMLAGDFLSKKMSCIRFCDGGMMSGRRDSLVVPVAAFCAETDGPRVSLAMSGVGSLARSRSSDASLIDSRAGRRSSKVSRPSSTVLSRASM